MPFESKNAPLTYQRIVILWYIVSKEGKFLDPKKIQALVNMPTSKNVKATDKFNDLAVFNRCCLKNYTTIMEPITQLTKKN